MTEQQFKMAINILSTNNKVNLKDFSLEIKTRISTICELDLFIEGRKTVLCVGTISECLQNAKEYLLMRYGIDK